MADRDLFTSSDAINWAYNLPDAVPKNERLLLAFLCSHVSERNEGRVWPSQGRMVRCTGMSRSTVKRSLKSLEDLGLIVREKRPRVGRTQDVDLIEINFDAQIPVWDSVESVSPSSQDSIGVHTEPVGVHPDPRGVHPGPWGGSPWTPEPQGKEKEPPREPIPGELEHGSGVHPDRGVRDEPLTDPPPQVRGFKSAGDIFGGLR